MRLVLNNLTISQRQPKEFGPNLISNLTHWYKHNTNVLESDASAAEDEDDVTQWSDSKGTNHLQSEEDNPVFVGSDNSIFFADENKDMLTTSEITLDGDFAV